MCGRFAQAYRWAEYREGLALIDAAQPGANAPPRWNIPPSLPIDVALTAPGGRQNQPMRWGLIPPWAKGAPMKYPSFNARAETLAEKPTFRDSFRHRRCLIPASGFYEWQKEGRTKRPFWIHPKDGPLFVFAGLWAESEGPEGTVLSVTIITCAAAGPLAEIHPRTPVILPAEAWPIWEEPQAGRADLEALLRPAASERIAFHEVDPRVGRVDQDDAGLIEPARPATLL